MHFSPQAAGPLRPASGAAGHGERSRSTICRSIKASRLCCASAACGQEGAPSISSMRPGEALDLGQASSPRSVVDLPDLGHGCRLKHPVAIAGAHASQQAVPIVVVDERSRPSPAPARRSRASLAWGFSSWDSCDGRLSTFTRRDAACAVLDTAVMVARPRCPGARCGAKAPPARVCARGNCSCLLTLTSAQGSRLGACNDLKESGSMSSRMLCRTLQLLLASVGGMTSPRARRCTGIHRHGARARPCGGHPGLARAQAGACRMVLGRCHDLQLPGGTWRCRYCRRRVCRWRDRADAGSDRAAPAGVSRHEFPRLEDAPGWRACLPRAVLPQATARGHLRAARRRMPLWPRGSCSARSRRCPSPQRKGCPGLTCRCC